MTNIHANPNVSNIIKYVCTHEKKIQYGCYQNKFYILSKNIIDLLKDQIDILNETNINIFAKNSKLITILSENNDHDAKYALYTLNCV